MGILSNMKSMENAAFGGASSVARIVQ